MKCPVCKDSVLKMTEKKGVEIDCCPSCRGVWLDWGELTRLTVFQGASDSGHPLPRTPEYFREARLNSEQNGYHNHKKKKSFLEKIFD